MSKPRIIIAAMLLMSVVAVPARAGAIVADPLFQSISFAANDDGSVGLIAIGFGLNFFGQNYSQLYVNNNGNVTFTQPFGTFTPSGITGGSLATLAPFWADVDTRYNVGAPLPSNLVTYGQSTFNGHAAFGVDWIGVGYYQFSPTAARNSFQLVIVDRSDIAAGDFDFMFNYDQIQWEAGQASQSDAAGCNGVPAHAGWTNGAGTFQELAGSGVHGGFTDPGFCGGGQATQLDNHSLNSNVLGRYEFNVRSGVVVPTEPSAVPEPATMLMFGTGLSLIARRLRKNRQ